MSKSLPDQNNDPLLHAFIAGKSAQTMALLNHFIAQYEKLGYLPEDINEEVQGFMRLSLA